MVLGLPEESEAAVAKGWEARLGVKGRGSVEAEVDQVRGLYRLLLAHLLARSRQEGEESIPDVGLRDRGFRDIGGSTRRTCRSGRRP